MLSSAEKLASIDAKFCVAPCNTIHHVFEIVASRSPLPWLHIADEVAPEAKRLGCGRVALLGTRFMMESDVYLQRTQARIVIGKIDADVVDGVVLDLNERVVAETLKRDW